MLNPAPVPERVIAVPTAGNLGRQPVRPMSALSRLRGQKHGPPGQVALDHPHALDADQVLERLQTSHHGLTLAEARSRLERFGPKSLPRARAGGLLHVFLRQFLNPLIDILLAAAAVSLLLEDWSDAGSIFGVLLINAVIGTAQEHSAERSASALQELVTTNTRVLRRGDAYEIDARELGLAAQPQQVVTGRELAEAEQRGPEAVARLATQARVLARVEPQKKPATVRALEHNGALLLMVSFENVQVFNSRSETRSAFRHNLLSNPLLLFGTAAAQLVHIGAMYTPWLRDVLGVAAGQPRPLESAAWHCAEPAAGNGAAPAGLETAGARALKPRTAMPALPRGSNRRAVDVSQSIDAPHIDTISFKVFDWLRAA